ncbi:Hypothetical transmembrane protein [Mycoplasma mycoides subsp. mycoides SC str. PG1]|uniref:Hypothetical transmembrane protein n=1 Tax=Mycoplasma mycoides subsp. mycoides SC (strain CCUG 32753 / NCTC 10114 / PG1) TaxID=272632 RepID=Q6MSN7_MYCMS|nr:Hypothetical transmembrane protein [Mycoplasma mycoides subsp. mycoides SC str. PG1]
MYLISNLDFILIYFLSYLAVLIWVLDFLAIRTFLPLIISNPTFVTWSLFFGSCNATFDIWSFAGISLIPPSLSSLVGLTCFLTVIPWTETHCLSFVIEVIGPICPLCEPAITLTTSPFKILDFAINWFLL